jgi:hypothetical protein
VNYLSANLRLNGPHKVRRVDGSKTLFDPVVGVQLRMPDTGQRWHTQVYTETGGFGVGSDFTRQVFPTIGVRLTERASLDLQKTDIEPDATRRALVLTGSDLVGHVRLSGVPLGPSVGDHRGPRRRQRAGRPGTGAPRTGHRSRPRGQRRHGGRYHLTERGSGMMLSGRTHSSSARSGSGTSAAKRVRSPCVGSRKSRN